MEFPNPPLSELSGQLYRARGAQMGHETENAAALLQYLCCRNRPIRSARRLL